MKIRFGEDCVLHLVAGDHALRVQTVQALDGVVEAGLPALRRMLEVTGAAFHQQQCLGHGHRGALGIADTTLLEGETGGTQLIDQRLERINAEHVEDAAHLAQLLQQPAECRRIVVFRIEMGRQQVLGDLNFLAHGRGHRLQG